MRKCGIFLIVAGLICILSFAVFTIASEPDIPVMIKLGVSAAIIGLVIVILGLVLERLKENKGSDKNDLSKY